MFVNKYIRCVAACLCVVGGCVCVDANAMSGNNQQINPNGGAGQTKQVQRVQYKINVKSSMDECQKSGDIYVKKGEDGKIEKGILLYKGSRADEKVESKRKDLFYVQNEGVGGCVEDEGYFCRSEEGGEKKVGLEEKVSETGGFTERKVFLVRLGAERKSVDVTCRWKKTYRDCVGGNGSGIYSRVFELITRFCGIGVLSSMEECQKPGDIYVKKGEDGKIEKGILLYKGSRADEKVESKRKDLFYVQNEGVGGCVEDEGYFCRSEEGGEKKVGLEEKVSETGGFTERKVFLVRLGAERKNVDVTCRWKKTYRDCVGGNGSGIYSRVFELITRDLNDDDNQAAPVPNFAISFGFESQFDKK